MKNFPDQGPSALDRQFVFCLLGILIKARVGPVSEELKSSLAVA
jgi:hypothetical protein